jgi:hypothetical protein
VAVSKDGVHFQVSDGILGDAYFRVFSWGGRYYAIDGNGNLNRSKYPDREWNKRDNLLIRPVTLEDDFDRQVNVRIRHSAVMLTGNTLYIFYTRKGDAPERILVSTVELSDDWEQWRASKPVEVMRPEKKYEGVNNPIKPSKKGKGVNVHQLRDPYLFEDNGRQYLFYSIAGEMGIAMAEIKVKTDINKLQ